MSTAVGEGLSGCTAGLTCTFTILTRDVTGVLQCVAVCCNALQYVTVFYSVSASCSSLLFSFAMLLVCCSVLQCVAVCCHACRHSITRVSLPKSYVWHDSFI